jgi:serine/threonine-protein kinase
VVNLLRMRFRAQYEVLVATSGPEALALLRERHVDVLVSDQRMPGMTGIELLARARHDSPQTIRLLLAGYTDLAAIVGTVDRGEVFRFLNKPWDHRELQAALAAAVAAARGAHAAPAALATPAADEPDAAQASVPRVLLIADDPHTLGRMAEMAPPACGTRTAGSLVEALQVLACDDVGVVVTTARVGQEDVGGFLRVLNKQYPAITVVMLTPGCDTAAKIRHAHRAQVFRFVDKPLRRNTLAPAISAAMHAHIRHREHPGAPGRLQDEPTADTPSRLRRLVQSMGRWAGRFSGRQG